MGRTKHRRRPPLTGSVLSETDRKHDLLSNGYDANLEPRSALTNKSDGIAQTQVIASSRATSFVVVAEAGEKVAASPSLTFAGSVPNWRRMG